MGAKVKEAAWDTRERVWSENLQRLQGRWRKKRSEQAEAAGENRKMHWRDSLVAPTCSAYPSYRLAHVGRTAPLQ